MKENWEINWKDYYKTLQVDPMAEPEVIEGVFTRLSKKYHPDVNPDPHASQHMKELNEAHDVLGNAEKRKQYHAVYLQRTGKSSSYGAPPPPRPSYTPPPIKPKPEVNPSMLRFQGLVPGESRREPFILKNSGGPYSKIWVSNSKSLWMNIVRQKPLSNLGKLPLLIEVEVLGTDWGKFYSDNIIIKLDNVEVSVRVEVQTQPKPEQPKSKETDEQKESDRINDLSDKTKRERTPNTIPQATQPKRRTIGRRYRREKRRLC